MNNLTAIVTGASEGLGKSLALELAERGIHLILVALPDSGLNELAGYIKKITAWPYIILSLTLLMQTVASCFSVI